MKLTMINDAYSFENRVTLCEDMFGKRYIMKASSIDAMIRELLADYIATLLNLNHVNYFRYKKGLLSPDFRKPNTVTKSGRKFISDIPENVIESKRYPGVYDVELALNFRFIYYQNFEKQKNDMLFNIIDMILFDLLIVNPDRHTLNWDIFFDYEQFGLIPIFDNNAAFSDSNCCIFNLFGGIEENENVMRQLLDSKFSDYALFRMQEFMNIINPDTIDGIIRNVLVKNGLFFQLGIANEISKNFKKNYNDIFSALSKSQKSFLLS
ncbi:MAG: hypothetical protein PHD02_04285 [Bacilli bacterium]|nr:hypothetical protein [Bacilli bacterium]